MVEDGCCFLVVGMQYGEQVVVFFGVVVGIYEMFDVIENGGEKCWIDFVVGFYFVGYDVYCGGDMLEVVMIFVDDVQCFYVFVFF